MNDAERDELLIRLDERSLVGLKEQQKANGRLTTVEKRTGRLEALKERFVGALAVVAFAGPATAALIRFL